MRPIDFVQRLQNIDRRLIYVVVAIVLGIPCVVKFSLPIFADRYSRKTFEVIDRITRDPVEKEKVVLVLSNWGPASEGENGPQLQYVLQHLLRRGVRFMLCSTGDAVPWAVADAYLEKAIVAEKQRAYQLGEPIPEFVYGVDYLKLGFNFCTVFEPVAKTLVLDTRSFYAKDIVLRKELTDENFPLLEHFHGVEDLALVYVVSHTEDARIICGTAKRQVPELLVATAVTGITANDMYPYVKSGQLCGLLNSSRGASEYKSLLEPGDVRTNARDNSQSLGKLLLLVLVVLGNLAYLLTRRAERAGTLRPLPLHSKPMSDLPKTALRMLGYSFAAFYLGTIGLELYNDISSHTVPRHRVARADDDENKVYPAHERMNREDLLAEQEAQLDDTEVARRAQVRADAGYALLIEGRIGEFVAALMTIGILAFLLGENKLYRVTEAIMVGAAMAYTVFDNVNKQLVPRWIQPIVEGTQRDGNHWNVLWALLLIPGVLWYFVYSKKYRWLNQLVVAMFVGLVVGPEFGNRLGQLVPQIVDCVQPIWPIWPFAADGALGWRHFEHFTFLVIMILSLTYFIFFLRPKTKAGKGVITAGRLAMMIGFGVMFANTVNTRLAWLSPRISYLLDDWLGKLFAS